MHEIQITVRFCETDALGHINNTNYFVYFEEARVHFLEDMGFGSDVKKWNYILASVKCDFLHQGYFNQELLVTTTVTKIGTKSFHLEHEVLCNKTKQVIAKGSDVIVFFNFRLQQSEPLPEFLKECLKKHLMPAASPNP